MVNVKRCLILSLMLFSPLAQADEIPSVLVSMGDGKYYSSTAIVVDKSLRRLQVWENTSNGVIKRAEFPSDLGKNEGDKLARGDHKTPEGIYFLEQLLEGSSLNFDEYGVKAFTTNYPNLFDKRDGKTGDGIWLHAIPDTKSLERGSRGCVVVRNEAIIELSKYIKLGATPIVISDSIKFAQRAAVTETKKRIENFVAQWRASWETKHIESYMNFYSDNFKSLGMNKNQWKAYKNGLNNKYQSISVELSQPVVFEHRGRMVVRVLQKYASDQHADFGEKWLYLEQNPNGEYAIVAEEWSGIQNTTEALQAMSSYTRSAASSN